MNFRKVYCKLISTPPFDIFTRRKLKNGCEIVFHNIPDKYFFEKQISAIYHQYNPITLDEYILLVKNKELRENDILITFDDGTEDFYINALPVLQKMNCPATLFVCGCILEEKRMLWFMEYSYLIKKDPCIFNQVAKKFGAEGRAFNKPIVFLKNLPHKLQMSWIEEAKKILKINYMKDDPTNRLMTFSQLKRVKDIPLVTIGAHTWDHVILANESLHEIEHQIVDTVHELRTKLNIPVRSMAYPNGIFHLDFDQRAISFAQKAGLDVAFSLEDDNPYNCSMHSLPRRVPINYDYTVNEIIARIEHKWPTCFTLPYKEKRIRRRLH